MKKTFKKFISCFFAATLMVTATVSSFTSSAYRIIAVDGTEIEPLCDPYGEVTPRLEDLWSMYKDNNSGEPSYIYKSVYNMDDYYYSCHTFEWIYDGNRYLRSGQINWRLFKFNSKYVELHSEEEINAFLSDNNLKAQIDSYSATENSSGTSVTVTLKYDDASCDDIIDTALAMYKEFDVYPHSHMNVSSKIIPINETTENTESTSPTVTFGTPTIAGDVNMDGATSMADIAKLAKYASNAELFPITDPTALANADVTQDGVIDSLDTNMLIEIALSTYESAV